MNNDPKSIAQLMGMRESEIVEVVLDADGLLVQTHDGIWTLIGNDGELVHCVRGPAGESDEAEAAMLRGFHGDPEPEVGPAKAAPKRRSRS